MASKTVAQLCHDRFGFAIGNGPARFQIGGWFDVGESICPCPLCGHHLWGFRKPYESADKTYFFWALVCSCCKTALEPRELSIATRKKLYAISTHRPAAVAAGSLSMQVPQALTCKLDPDHDASASLVSTHETICPIASELEKAHGRLSPGSAVASALATQQASICARRATQVGVNRHGVRAALGDSQDLPNEDGSGGWTYLLLSEWGEVYLGATKNLRKRFRAHNGPSNGRFTGGRRWHLLAVRKFETRAEAFDEEARMKSGGYGKSEWKVACIPRALQLIARYGYEFNPYHWQYNYLRSMEARRQRERERKERARALRTRYESKTRPGTGRTTQAARSGPTKVKA